MILEVKIIRVSSYDILLCTADKPRSTLTGSMERRIAFAERGPVATQPSFTFYPPIVQSFLQRSSTWRITVSNVPDRSSSIGRIFSHLSLSVPGNAWSWQVYRRKCSSNSWFVRLSSAHTHTHTVTVGRTRKRARVLGDYLASSPVFLRQIRAPRLPDFPYCRQYLWDKLN